MNPIRLYRKEKRRRKKYFAKHRKMKFEERNGQYE